jgi:preprotein translocase subunit SecG
MIGFLTVIHVVVCVLLIVSILLQSSKGGGLAGVFGGGGGMGTVFGGRGAASFLSKVTMWLGIAFAVTSITIALMSPEQKSMLEQVNEQQSDSILNTISDGETGETGGETLPLPGE